MLNLASSTRLARWNQQAPVQVTGGYQASHCRAIVTTTT
jgi:hypothetical protein